jgi:hypothetical protein
MLALGNGHKLRHERVGGPAAGNLGHHLLVYNIAPLPAHTPQQAQYAANGSRAAKVLQRHFTHNFAWYPHTTYYSAFLLVSASIAFFF